MPLPLSLSNAVSKLPELFLYVSSMSSCFLKTMAPVLQYRAWSLFAEAPKTFSNLITMQGIQSHLTPWPPQTLHCSNTSALKIFPSVSAPSCLQSFIHLLILECHLSHFPSQCNPSWSWKSSWNITSFVKILHHHTPGSINCSFYVFTFLYFREHITIYASFFMHIQSSILVVLGNLISLPYLWPFNWSLLPTEVQIPYQEVQYKSTFRPFNVSNLCLTTPYTLVQTTAHKAPNPQVPRRLHLLLPWPRTPSFLLTFPFPISSSPGKVKLQLTSHRSLGITTTGLPKKSPCFFHKIKATFFIFTDNFIDLFTLSMWAISPVV